MMTDWSMNLDVARHRHTADLAKAEHHRLGRRSRRARRRGTPDSPLPGATIVALPPRPKSPLSQPTPDAPARLAT